MISSLQLTQLGDHLLSGSWDKTIAVWDLSVKTKDKISYSREIPCENKIMCLLTIGDRSVAYGSLSGFVVLIDWISGNIMKRLATS